MTDSTIIENTDLLRQQNEFLLRENASKNTMVKISVENQQHANNTKKLNSSESFKTVKSTSIKNHYKQKSQKVVCSNRYDTLYQRDDSD